VEALEGRCLLSAGDLDPTFGRRGLVVEPTALSPDGGTLVAEQDLGAAGKFIVALGMYGTVQRFSESNGRVDGAFGDHGSVHVGGGNATHPIPTFTAMTVEVNGKILISRVEGGISPYDDEVPHVTDLLRLNADGTADTSFGPNHDGRVVLHGISGHPEFYVNLLAEQPGGEVIAAGPYKGTGISIPPANAIDVGVLRLNADGSADPTFSSGGTFDPADGDMSASAIAIKPDGSILLAGAHNVFLGRPEMLTLGPDGNNPVYLESPRAGAGNYQQTIMRPDGSTVLAMEQFFQTSGISLDGGATFVPFNLNVGAQEAPSLRIAPLPDGGVIVAAEVNGGFAVADLDASGDPVQTFGLGGTSFVRLAGRHSPDPGVFVRGVYPQADGSVLIAGELGQNLLFARVVLRSHLPSDAPPTVGYVINPDVWTQREHRLTVKFLGANAINVSTLDDSDIVVTGPNGYKANATLVRTNDTTNVVPSANQTPVTIEYAINAPGGTWDPTDNGTYFVRLRPDQVLDVTGKPVPEGVIARFKVSLQWPDVQSVSTQLDGVRVRRSASQTKVTVQVSYVDAFGVGLDRGSFGDDDLIINGPLGRVRNVRLQQLVRHDRTWLATYTFVLSNAQAAPLGGDETFAITGPYVDTAAGHPLKTETLGTFTAGD
jgi:uncharacterized delta-60 repeat protein